MCWSRSSPDPRPSRGDSLPPQTFIEFRLIVSTTPDNHQNQQASKNRMVRVKPTSYRGVLMRSRTEARAAEWLETNGWNWLYEPESFLADTQYTPDFYIPDIDTLIEVKPAVFIHETERIRSIVEKLGKPFAILCPGHANSFFVADLYGPLPPCDPWNNGEDSPWGWHSEAPDEYSREISVDNNGGRFPRNYIYMGAGCHLRWQFDRDCPCTN